WCRHRHHDAGGAQPDGRRRHLPHELSEEPGLVRDQRRFSVVFYRRWISALADRVLDGAGLSHRRLVWRWDRQENRTAVGAAHGFCRWIEHRRLYDVRAVQRTV